MFKSISVVPGTVGVEVEVLSSHGTFHSNLTALCVPACYTNREKVVVISRNIAKTNLRLLHLFGPFLVGHIRDPNNQLHTVKNLRICINNVTTSSSTPSAALSPAQCRVLSDVVSSCQPHEGAVTSVITAGDYDLSVSGKKPPHTEPEVL